ncbi:MAG: Asp-tRNA(Asn)/Glu-tRNA(Gln) amidotransferase subunit GatB [Candidatus Ancaeobacter aquaticus]|nr:Asp-tRNA(Asn)/Glu-tRNA(Gln) amidotransferase subunit GatB [Candidatus Ancaeobacter aquaticus]
MEYEAVIGLEVHVQLKTKSKMFCGCPTVFGAQPNTQVCPVCLGLPGVLPVVNKKAVIATIKTGLMLGSTISHFSKFDRKNYYYPDLPKNYQVSQFDKPLCLGGSIDVELDGVGKSIGVTRVHLEEDAGKLTHMDVLGKSGVDFNRTGIPLMEIVSEPDMHTPEEAFEYLKAVKQIITYLEVSDCNMEEGSLRCDANVSIRPVGETKLGTKAEVKNMNSFSNVRKALTFEIDRLKECVSRNERIIQETRLWDVTTQKTFSMRSKEEAHDYRYFPEPDLVPMQFSDEYIESIRATIPEMPAERKERFIQKYGLNDYTAGVMTSEKAIADYFEQCTSQFSDFTMVANWIMGDLLRDLNENNIAINMSPVSTSMLVDMLKLIENKTISGKIAKDVFVDMFKTGKQAKIIVKEKGLMQITDESAIRDIAKDVIAHNKASAEDYRKGKKQAIGFLVGQVMKATKGKANPQLVNKMLVEEIEKSE